MTFINSQEGARGPDRSLGPDPGYAFQGVFDSVRSGVKAIDSDSSFSDFVL